MNEKRGSAAAGPRLVRKGSILAGIEPTQDNSSKVKNYKTGKTPTIGYSNSGEGGLDFVPFISVHLACFAGGRALLAWRAVGSNVERRYQEAEGL